MINTAGYSEPMCDLSSDSKVTPSIDHDLAFHTQINDTQTTQQGDATAQNKGHVSHFMQNRDNWLEPVFMPPCRCQQ